MPRSSMHPFYKASHWHTPEIKIGHALLLPTSSWSSRRNMNRRHHHDTSQRSPRQCPASPGHSRLNQLHVSQIFVNMKLLQSFYSNHRLSCSCQSSVQPLQTTTKHSLWSLRCIPDRHPYSLARSMPSFLVTALSLPYSPMAIFSMDIFYISVRCYIQTVLQFS